MRLEQVRNSRQAPETSKSNRVINPDRTLKSNAELFKEQKVAIEGNRFKSILSIVRQSP